MRIGDARHLRDAHRLAVAERAAVERSPPTRSECRRRHDANRQGSLALERDEGRPYRDATRIALRAVDGVHDPTPIRGGSGDPELLAQHRVARARPGDHRTQLLLHGAVGLRDRREVGLGVDDEVGGTKARQGDAVGDVGELEGEREIGVDAGGM